MNPPEVGTPMVPVSKTHHQRWIRAAQAALDASRPTGEKPSPVEDLTDLLAHLRHWADQVGVDFDHASAVAQFHYEDELKSGPF